jgi:nucleolar protein 15
VVELEVDEQTKKNMQEKVAQNRKSVLRCFIVLTRQVMDIEHTDPRGVIYLGHIPYGMEEPQMKKFFSQFGDVTRVKLWRSKKVSTALPLLDHTDRTS